MRSTAQRDRDGKIEAGDIASSWDKIPIFPVSLVLITVIATALRFHALGSRGFWLDETTSVDIAQNNFGNFLRIVGLREIDMALYFVLLHFWMILGDSEFVIRSMSLVFSVLTIPFIYALGSRLFGRNTALVAAGLLALNAFHIRYAQEARSYSLVVLLGTMATWLLVRNLQGPAKAWWAWYGVCLSMAVYSHLLSGLLIVLVHVIAIAFLPLRIIPWKGLVRAGAWFGCLTLPMGIIVHRSMVTVDPLNWLGPTEWLDVLHFLVLTAGNKGLLLLSLDAIMVGTAIVLLVRSYMRSGRTLENWALVLVLLWSFVPVVTLFAASQFKPMFQPRYLLPSVPGFLLAVSVGLLAIRPRSIAWTLSGAILLFTIAGASKSYDLQEFVSDWRVISYRITDQAKPADGIAFYPNYSRVPFEYYRVRQKQVPEWPISITAGASAHIDRIDPNDLKQSEEQSHVAINRLWLVFHHASPISMSQRRQFHGSIVSWRTKGWNLSDVQEFPDVAVLLFSASSTDAVPARDLPSFYQSQSQSVAQNQTASKY